MIRVNRYYTFLFAKCKCVKKRLYLNLDFGLYAKSSYTKKIENWNFGIRLFYFGQISTTSVVYIGYAVNF